MPTSGTDRGRREPPLADAEFLARADHRVAVLDALAAEPRSRRELEDLTSVSRTTVGRTLTAMERRRWVERDGDRFDATPLGAFVVGSMGELLHDIETARLLEDVWDSLPTDEEGFDVEACAEGVVTVAGPDEPYAPVNRYVALLEDSDRLRFVGSDVGLFEPCKDELRRFVLEGMQAEIVDPPEHARYVLSTYAEHCRPMFESGNLTVRVHDDLPTYGLGILDDRVFVCGYHRDDGTARVLVDTASPSVREWAEETYRRYRREARTLPEIPTS